MVNLLKFRDKAQYEDGRDPDLSGREAYNRYGVEVEKLVRAAGGRVLFAGDVTFLRLGRVESLWDEVALAEYPKPRRAPADVDVAGLAGDRGPPRRRARGSAQHRDRADAGAQLGAQR